MRVLVIGGTRFIGPPIVDRLLSRGHELTLFHRGETGADRWPEVARIHGDRKRIGEHADVLRAARPDVVLDMIALSEADARGVVETFRGVAARTVTVSSADVYAAFGRAVGLEEGPPVPVPFDEDAPLRKDRFPYRGKAPRLEDYEKILVETATLADPELPGTVVRLPMVYGPEDYQHRFHDWLHRMDAGRPAILLDESAAGWRCARAYVEDVAASLVAAIENEAAAGRIYHVAEPDAPTQAEWVGLLAGVVGWDGRVVVLPGDRCPESLRADVDPAHDVLLDTSRIRAELGFEEETSREEALRRTVAWERDNPPPVDPDRFDFEAEDAALAAGGENSGIE